MTAGTITAAELRRLRREARVSADAVAPLIGMTPSALRARERGERGEWYPELVRRYVDAVEQCSAARQETTGAAGQEVKRRIGVA